MKKNLFLAFVLVMMTFSFKGLGAKEFEQPSWKSDFQVENVDSNDEESVRLPSSGPQDNYKTEDDPSQAEQKSDVKPWKFESKEDY